MKAIDVALIAVGLLLPSVACTGPVYSAFDARHATVNETLWHHDNDDSSATSAMLGRGPSCPFLLFCIVPKTSA